MSPYFLDIKTAAAKELPWDLLSGKNILVAGASGLIGSCLVRILMSRPVIDFQLYTICRNAKKVEDKFKEYIAHPNFHTFVHDITEPLETDLQFHFIIDAASSASPAAYRTSPVNVVRDNIYGVDNLLKYGVDHNMQRFLYVSSGEIYGEGSGQAFTETDSGYVDCLSPRSCYPSSKRAAESLSRAYSTQYGANVVIARPCHIYGPEFNDNDDRVYAEFLRRSISGEDIVLKSPGSQYRSWCYVVDCASALIYILLKGENGEAYNISDPESNVTIKELAGIVASMADSRIIFKSPTKDEASGFNPVKMSTFSNTKLRALGWAPQYDLNTSIQHCYQHLQSIIPCPTDF